jgi:hypothetical protein
VEAWLGKDEDGEAGTVAQRRRRLEIRDRERT